VLGPGVFVSEDTLTLLVDNFLGSQDINKFLNCSRVAGKNRKQFSKPARFWIVISANALIELSP
jgi:hypothetical protein